MSFEPKKMAVLRILQILEKYSDRDHPLTQERILYYLERDYGIELERKAVGKNLDLLRDANYDIVSDRHGTYLAERAFDDSEVRFLIDSVLYAKNVGPVYAKHLVENLSKLGSRTFQEQLRTSYVIERLHDTKFSDFFYHIDLLQEAIERERKVSFWVRRYEEDKQLHPVYDTPITVDPYRLVNVGGKYYLLAAPEDDTRIVNYRIEFLSEVTIREQLRRHISETELGRTAIDEYIHGHPFMYCGELVYARMRVSRRLFPDLIDAFGKDFTVREYQDPGMSEWYVEVGLRAGGWDLFQFALEHLGMVELLSPEFLRKRVMRYVKDGYRDYFFSEEERKDGRAPSEEERKDGGAPSEEERRQP